MTSVWRLDVMMSVTSLTTPLQLSVFISDWNTYFTTSNQFTVEKTSMPSIFLIQYSVSLGSTSQYGSKNGSKLPVHTDFKTMQFFQNQSRIHLFSTVLGFNRHEIWNTVWSRATGSKCLSLTLSHSFCAYNRRTAFRHTHTHTHTHTHIDQHGTHVLSESHTIWSWWEKRKKEKFSQTFLL